VTNSNDVILIARLHSSFFKNFSKGEKRGTMIDDKFF